MAQAPKFESHNTSTFFCNLSIHGHFATLHLPICTLVFTHVQTIVNNIHDLTLSCHYLYLLYYHHGHPIPFNLTFYLWHFHIRHPHLVNGVFSSSSTISLIKHSNSNQCQIKFILQIIYAQSGPPFCPFNYNSMSNT